MAESRLGPAGGAGTAVAPGSSGGVAAGGGLTGTMAASHRSRSIFPAESLPSTARLGLSVSASEPVALSCPSASRKSLAEIAVCETSTAPSNRNFPASSGGRLGAG